jgi:hypothetical protein
VISHCGAIFISKTREAEERKEERKKKRLHALEFHTF